MADGRRYALGAQLDIEQILAEAQHRWLRPAEICEILRNYTKFQIATEPGNRPPNGSLFLFDRKVLRYFRKDGHNWRKKKDGKTVKEAHERLKAGSIDVLHCYYAHGEDNENFQRRSYWLLEEELSNIVLVHYREVKGNRTNANRTREVGEATPNSLESEDKISSTASEVNSSVSSKFHSYNYNSLASQTTDNSTHTSEYEDVESDDYDGKFQANPDMSFVALMQGSKIANNLDADLTYAFESYRAGSQPVSYQPTNLSTQSYNTGFDRLHGFRGNPAWQIDAGYNNLGVSYAEISNPLETANAIDQHNKPLAQDNLELHLAKEDGGKFHNSNLDGNLNLNEDEKSGSLRPPYLDGFMKEGLKKLDSFDRWMSKELGDVKESQSQSTSETYWEAVESENGVDDSIISPQVHLDSFVLGPSLSQDQLFTIIDFSPNWAYAGSEIKVLVTGRFLRSQQELQHCEWACMFGELEVPAEVVADGVLRCHTPEHKSGRVHFYVTCSNRLACSEVREFEFKVNEYHQDMDGPDVIGGDNSNETLLHMRFVKLLSFNTQNSVNSVNDPELISQLSSLIQEDNSEWDQMIKFTSEEAFSSKKARSQLFQKLLKEKLHSWLLHKVAEGGKGASVLDEDGQGVLHFAGALGYDWAIQPTVAAGVSINFRDVNGWTALHWAASCGRERTVAFLISQGAAAGALTDPSPRHPTGRTPADLASSNGDKGIAGYCAEAALSAHLQLINLKDANKDIDVSSLKPVQPVTERTPTPVSYGDMPQGLSLKDSLAAVCNATQAAARIHQVFRVQSFQKKQLKEHGGSEFGLSDERALSLLALKTPKTGQHDEPVHSAAVRIQNKFRSWKGRKDFLIMRQRVVKIQAHVRGHQVRKNYKKIVWSVGILDKVILRWRRKGSGLRGFKSEQPIAEASSSTMEVKTVKEDDDDFFEEGRKQTEQRLQKALARVKSMAQYPEARDQYRRLLNVVNDMQESKAVYEKALDSETICIDDDLIDIDVLLGDDEADAFMTI
ncbi:calmodulin-binding transcription activator 3-like isoform X2 [Rutidosis leptorrhynchoides]|uniref:calmodulin-binding transcription activator 3-like isoform X2 n=1 Tax=Rutidosis leptorrhynchoides TaxID=125765 RepID=UPI003A9A1D67